MGVTFGSKDGLTSTTWKEKILDGMGERMKEKSCVFHVRRCVDNVCDSISTGEGNGAKVSVFSILTLYKQSPRTDRPQKYIQNKEQRRVHCLNDPKWKFIPSETPSLNIPKVCLLYLQKQQKTLYLPHFLFIFYRNSVSSRIFLNKNFVYFCRFCKGKYEF